MTVSRRKLGASHDEAWESTWALQRQYLVANLRRLRERAKLTQEQTAERAGVDVTYVQKLERTGANVTLRALVSIAMALGCGVGDLLAPTAPAAKRRPGRPHKAKAADLGRHSMVAEAGSDYAAVPVFEAHVTRGRLVIDAAGKLPKDAVVKLTPAEWASLPEALRRALAAMSDR